MNLMEMLQRMMDEQKWREQKAMSMSSGLGSMPYAAQDQMQFRSPQLLEQLMRNQNSFRKDEAFSNEAPEGELERMLMNRAMQMKQRERQRLNSPL